MDFVWSVFVPHISSFGASGRWCFGIVAFPGYLCKENFAAILQIGNCLPITKTCPLILTTLKPHFYIVKLRFTGVYIIFLILLKNIACGYSLEPPRRGGSNEYHNVLSRNMKNIRIFN